LVEKVVMLVNCFGIVCS